MHSIEVPKNGHSSNGHSTNGHNSNGHNGSYKYNTTPNGSPFKNTFLKGYNSNVTEAEEL